MARLVYFESKDQKGTKMGQNRTKIEPKWDQKWNQDKTKMGQNRTKMGPKMNQN